jgi:hypothetical protein
MTVKFIGGDRYVSGVPARDLTDAEWAALSDEERVLCEGLGLYQVPRPAKTNSSKSASGGGEE